MSKVPCTGFYAVSAGLRSPARAGRGRGRAETPRPAGHTLAELLVVLGLTASAAAFAAPTFRELGANLRRDALVEDLRAALLTARTEAVARGVPVEVCASADGRDCRPGSSWSHGWLVRPRGLGTGLSPRVLSAVRNDSALAVYGNRPTVEFQPTASAATTATFAVCDARGDSAARAVIVSRTGRVRVARGTEARCG
jgi:type IV fimbrial biogenesis protein FimT